MINVGEHFAGVWFVVFVPSLAADAILNSFLGRVAVGDYVALQAFIAPSAQITELLQQLRHLVRDRDRVATTTGYGPRFLHSTGQLHKGGPGSVLFIQFVDEPGTDLEVPETDFSFGRVLSAQADGDAAALVQRDRRLLRVNLGSDPSDGLARLASSLD